MIFALLFACAESPEEVEAEEVAANAWCANVTTDNWYTAAWTGATMEQVCRDQFRMTRGWDNPRPHPCTFGGYPMVCQATPEGGMLVVSTNGQDRIEVYPKDMDRVRDHLVIH